MFFETPVVQPYKVILDRIAIYKSVNSKKIGSLKKNEVIDIINIEDFGNARFGQLKNGNWIMLKSLENGFTFCEKISVTKSSEKIFFLYI